MKILPRLALVIVLLTLSWPLHAASVILLNEPFDGSSVKFRTQLKKAVSAAGFRVMETNGKGLASVLTREQGPGTVLLLPDGRYLPADAKGSLQEFLKRGNHLVAASGPAFTKLVVAEGSRWLSKESARDQAAADFSQPVLESLSPVYKTYRTTPGAMRRISTGVLSPLDEEIVCPIPRGRGLGCSGLRRYRYQPVIQALAHSGSARGSAAHMLLNNSGDYARSVWGFVGFNQAYLEKNASTTVPLMVSMLKRIEGGVFLAGGGTEHTAYAQGEKVKTGAYVSNPGAAPVQVRLDFTITKGRQLIRRGGMTASVSPAAREKPGLIAGPSMALPAGEYTVKTVLSVGGKTVDAILHDFRVIKFTGQDPKSAVTVDNGEFKLGGKVWRPLGVNYWPRYATGQEAKPFNHGLNWLSPEQYDPEIVEQDFTLMAKLGMNVISVQYNRLEEARNLMDVLARAGEHGLKVNVYIPGLHPLDQNFDLARSLIEAAHLPEQPAVFAYDCGWEVQIGAYNSRKRWDGEWQQWVIERYGSVESAEDQWGFRAERRDERITSPADEQLKTDGPWKLYVAAYRRFWDDEISERYAEVRAFTRGLDKYHLIGARSGYGGCGNPNAAHMFPFDLASGAKHLDFISPEATNLDIGYPAGCLKNGFTALYAQLASAGKPVVWAEYGNSIWPGCGAEQMEFQRQVYANTIQAAIESGSKGLIAWWWPGGWRLGEDSDYGIINPDGSPRPSALEIYKAAARFQQTDKIRRPDAFITIDRDRYTNGYAGIYVAHSAEYRQIVSSKKTPALKTEGAGTTSADTPMVAVGGVPYNGHNPPKYLNAEWNWITINGIKVTDGGTVEVERDKPIYIEASAANTAEAKWLASKGEGTGCVYLLAESGGEKILAPIDADAPFLGDAAVPKFELSPGIDSEKTYTFRMTSKGRMDFGNVVRVTVKTR